MQVKWGSCLSAPFSVGNGVRQGGLLSPALFNLYMDELSVKLSKCMTGCMIGNSLVNHFMYADDLAIVSPSSAGFQQLLNICTEYGVKYDVKYNCLRELDALDALLMMAVCYPPIDSLWKHTTRLNQ